MMKRSRSGNALKAVMLCLSLLMAGLMAAETLSWAYRDVRFIGKQGTGVLRGVTVAENGGNTGADMDPTELYDLAARQTVVIIQERLAKDDAGVAQSVGQSQGAGFIVSSDGYIITNCHVVSEAAEEARSVQVLFFDKTEYEAAIVGADAESDVALLKIEAQGLSAAQLGGSGEVLPCQTVYLMGHPAKELLYTMTSGIISALDRKIPFPDGTTLNMFQMDAAVNMGNSGGPVYNRKGQVIGVTTAKFGNLISEGLGFALPIDDVVAVAADLKEYGFVRNRPLMGITITSVKLEQFEGGSPAGALVYEVAAGLCGETAGLVKGDIITRLGETEVKNINDLSEAKKAYRAGDAAALVIWRKGESMTLEIVFDEVTPEHKVGAADLSDD